MVTDARLGIGVMSIYLLPLVLIVFLAQASCGADWVNLSGTIVWNKADELPERPIVDVSKFAKQVPSLPQEVRRFGWNIDPNSRAVAYVVVFVRTPKRIHPDFPQDAGETRKAFASFFRANFGVSLEEVKTVDDFPAESSLEVVPFLMTLRNFDCQPTTMAIRTGQPIVIVNKDSDVYCLHFFSKKNASQYCSPKEVKSHFFPAGTRNDVMCTIHPWMRLPVSVFDHPYFDSTDSEGHFRISRVPAGEIELCALFGSYSIDLGSGQIAYANAGDLCLKLTAKSDIDLGTIVLRGWPLK